MFDPLLMVAALGLVACSLVTLKGATRHAVAGHPLYYVDRQAIYAGLGFVIALILMRIDYSRLREYRYVMYGLLIALNIVVFGMPQVRGARRWIPLPFFQVQPSEFGKILLICSLSAFLVHRSRRLYEWRTTARVMLLALIPALIVIPQPDLGTGLVYVAVAFTILFVAGTSWKQLTALVAMFAASVAIVVAGAPALGVHVLKPYQDQRLTGFLNPSHDPQRPDLQHHRVADRDRVGREDRARRGPRDADEPELPARDPDGLHLRRRRRDVRFRGRGAGAVAVRVADLAGDANHDDVQEPLRNADRRRDPGDDHVPGVRERRDDVGIMPITGVPLPLMSYGGPPCS